MKRLIIALALTLALAAPAAAMEQVIFEGKPRAVVLEDGTEITALELPTDPNVYKPNATMVAVGQLGEWTIYHWLSEGAQLAVIKASGGYLGASWDELPVEAYKAVMEVEISEVVDGETVTRRIKLSEAAALGISYTAADVLPPHQWEGWE